MCGGGGASDQYAREQRAAEQARQSRITQGRANIYNNFAKFDDNFFKGRRDAYTSFAMPQLDQQYGDTIRNLTFALARQGIGASSEGNRRWGNLSQDYGLQRQQVVDKGFEVENDARRQVEDSRSALMQDLQATADPYAAARGATARATYLSAPQALSPLGTLFVNTLNGLNTYRDAKSDQEAYNAAMSTYGIGSSQPGGSGKNYGGP
jgi:hypothetical protein